MYRHWLYLILLSSIMNVVAARLVYGGDIKNIRRDFNLAMDNEGKHPSLPGGETLLLFHHKGHQAPPRMGQFSLYRLSGSP